MSDRRNIFQETKGYDFLNHQIISSERRNDIVVKIVLFLPVLNTIATLFTPYFIAGSINPGTIRAIISMLLFIFLFHKGLPSHRLIIPIYLLIILFLFSSLFSEQIFQSIWIYSRFLIASIFFLVGFKFLKTIESLQKLNKISMIILLLFLVNIIISNILKIGLSDYLENSIYYGVAGVNITKNMAEILLVSPLFFILDKNKMFKSFVLVMVIASLLFIIIGLKRSSIISLAIGVLVYLYYSPGKIRIFRISVLIIILLALFYPYYGSVLQARYEAREKKVSMKLKDIDEEEGRVQEFDIVMSKFKEKKITHKIFGTDPFTLKPEYFGKSRMIHVDYLNLLDGGGIVGLLLYLYIYWNIYYYIKRFKYQSVQNTRIIKEIKATAFALIAAQLALGFGGTITGIDLRGFILMYLGSFCGIFYEIRKRKYFDGAII